MSEGQPVTVVVGHFEPLAEVEAAELERIVAQRLPTLAARDQALEYELLVRLKVRRTVSSVTVAQDSKRLRGTMLLAARSTSRGAGGVEILTAVRRVPLALPRERVNRGRKMARVVPGERPLTCRETTVLKALSEGLTNTQIAHELHITPRTVHSHVRKIFRKLGVHNRRDLLRIQVPDGKN